MEWGQSDIFSNNNKKSALISQITRFLTVPQKPRMIGRPNTPGEGDPPADPYFGSVRGLCEKAVTQIWGFAKHNQFEKRPGQSKKPTKTTHLAGFCFWFGSKSQFGCFTGKFAVFGSKLTKILPYLGETTPELENKTSFEKAPLSTNRCYD